MENAFVINYTRHIQTSWDHRDFHQLLEKMAQDQSLEKWLETILSLQESRELFRDEEKGFVLMAYTEKRGQYRNPHDHGHCWVVYAVMSGSVEMGTFSKTLTGNPELLRQTKEVLNAGEARMFLRGDIHDTFTVSEKVIILRLTSCDLKVEDIEGRMNRYASALNL